MSPVLAEIADKMPTAVRLWGCHLTFGVVLFVVASSHRVVAYILLPAAVVFPRMAYHEAFLEGRFQRSGRFGIGDAMDRTIDRVIVYSNLCRNLGFSQQELAC